MDDEPNAIAARLTNYVDELVDARKRRDQSAIRGRTQLILNALGKLRAAYETAPFQPDLVERIRSDKTRAQLDLPETSEPYDNICWDCYAHGRRVFLDKRVDPVCRTCGWIQCPECGACRDPEFGGYPDRIHREPWGAPHKAE
jgi:hypothetical protein